MNELVTDVNQELVVLENLFWDKVGWYLPKAQLECVREAYAYAQSAHKGQIRKSGHEYFFHVLSVADILADLRASGYLLAAALLHDVIEDTPVTYDDIVQKFGSFIAYVVDGVTKIDSLETQSLEDKQSQNVNKMLGAMKRHPEVLVLKIADRLHNMRTLHYFTSEEKRKRIAKETLEVYAPLAARLGMDIFKSELENLGFKYLHPNDFFQIEERQNYFRGLDVERRERVRNLLFKLCRDNGLEEFDVYAREKEAYSIWSKMRKKHCDISQIGDLFAFRVIVPTAHDCYALLGMLHERFSVISSAFKDYISAPKENGYQALHTAIFLEEGSRPIEVQIRSSAMHDRAERGVAAHWAYKEAQAKGTQASAPAPQSIAERSMRRVRRLIDEDVDFENFKESEIFCFTPRGDVIGLPGRSCAVDFAYALHSNLGDTCVGARINGVWAPAERRLKSGDRVEILTAPNARPDTEWVHYVKTPRAKTRIHKIEEKLSRQKHIAKGRVLLQRYLCAFSAFPIETLPQFSMRQLRFLGYRSETEIYVDLGKGVLDPLRVAGALTDQQTVRSFQFHDRFCDDLSATPSDKFEKWERVVLIKDGDGYCAALEEALNPLGVHIDQIVIKDRRQKFVELALSGTRPENTDMKLVEDKLETVSCVVRSVQKESV